ncbi:MAG: 7-cyano-7-deazaguanine synthase QueC [Phycisphaerae bacterium]|nr:7-cyano-7-deazaguanine synthase QueC [Phycisphaerae bacterium]
MSFGLGHGRTLDDAPGRVGVVRDQFPTLPDSALSDPTAGRLDPREWFADPARTFEIEIGCGKGTFILETARANPGINYLGIEWAREFYLYAADRVRRAVLPNVRMLHTDGSEFLRWRCISGIVSVIHLYFSDPWPKTKHHKNRVVQHRFLAEAWRALRPGGELRIVTDHDELWEWDKEHFAAWTDATAYAALRAATPIPAAVLPEVDAAPFEWLPFTPPEWVGEGETVGTNYEKKFATDGKKPHAGVLRKIAAGTGSTAPQIRTVEGPKTTSPGSVPSAPPRRAVVLLSGGIDSATCLAAAKQTGAECHALSFDYGQRHRAELAAAERVARHLRAASHKTLPVNLRAIGGSALTAEIAVPKDRPAAKSDIPITYVPARNLVFLSLALGYAEVLGARELYIGVNAVDYSGYPDCREDFIRAFETTANLATRAGVEARVEDDRFHVRTPLATLTKSDILRMGVGLGVDYSLTLSCYDPSTDGRACGHCDSCLIRRRGFEEAGLPDPTRYAP